MKKLIIIGASGHGKVVADVGRLCGYENIVFLDDNDSLISCGKYPVVGRSNEIGLFDGDVAVAIGNAAIRQKIQERVDSNRLVTLIHPSAVVSADAEIGIGSVVMAGAVINPEARVGAGCIINTASSIDHDCEISDYVHAAVGSHIAGNVQIGSRTWIGVGATICNNITICSDCMIGAGAVVVKNIKTEGTYIGIPARKKLG